MERESVQDFALDSNKPYLLIIFVRNESFSLFGNQVNGILSFPDMVFAPKPGKKYLSQVIMEEDASGLQHFETDSKGKKVGFKPSSRKEIFCKAG